MVPAAGFPWGFKREQVLGPVGCTTVAWCPVALGDPANQLRGAQREGGEIDPTVLEPLGAEKLRYLLGHIEAAKNRQKTHT